MQVIKKVSDNQGDTWNALITLDVQNAFNTANWQLILQKLEESKISDYLINVISNYLHERTIQIKSGEIIEVNAGVPQGSVLGPTLWNILYNEVPELRLQGRAKTIAFADDLALIVTADFKSELIINTNENLKRIQKWMEKNELKLAPEKTEALLITRKRKREGISFKLGNVTITPKESVKYLGVHFDTRGSFGEHIKQTKIKAEDRVGKLTRLMLNQKF